MSDVWLTTVGTIGGCCGCMLGIESLVKHVGPSLHLMTFTTFVAIAVQGLWRNPRFLHTSCIPRRELAKIALLFFVISVANNESASLDVPFPLFIVFRSGTLLANVTLTFILQNRRFPARRLWAVVAVSVGIALFTIAERRSAGRAEGSLPLSTTESWLRYVPLPPFVVGILTMSGCLFGSAYMGIRQEQLYAVYGKHADEMMFNLHFLNLPLFVVVGRHIAVDAVDYATRWPALRPFATFDSRLTLPITWPYALLVAIVLMQLVCIRHVYQLTAHLSSLQVTMVLAIRKFLNLLLSYLLFDNPLTGWHLVGGALVLVGFIQFYDGFQQLHTRLRTTTAYGWWRREAKRKPD